MRGATSALASAWEIPHLGIPAVSGWVSGWVQASGLSSDVTTMRAPSAPKPLTGDAAVQPGGLRRSGIEQLAMIGACILGFALAPKIPGLGLVIGMVVAVYGAAVLLNFRGMRGRFLTPVGIERFPNEMTPWITGTTYTIIGVIVVTLSVSHIL